MASLGVWDGRVEEEVGVEQSWETPDILREAAGPRGKVRVVGRGSDSATPFPHPLPPLLMSPSPYLSRMFPV